MTGPAENSEFCFSLETLTKQPLGSVITAAYGVTCIGYIFDMPFKRLKDSSTVKQVIFHIISGRKDK